MSLGEVRQVSEDVYAYLQHDGNELQETCTAHTSSSTAESAVARSTSPAPSATWWPTTAASP